MNESMSHSEAIPQYPDGNGFSSRNFQNQGDISGNDACFFGRIPVSHTYWESVTVKESEVEMSISVGVGSPLLVVVAILVD